MMTMVLCLVIVCKHFWIIDQCFWNLLYSFTYTNEKSEVFLFSFLIVFRNLTPLYAKEGFSFTLKLDSCSHGHVQINQQLCWFFEKDDNFLSWEGKKCIKKKRFYVYEKNALVTLAEQKRTLTDTQQLNFNSV